MSSEEFWIQTAHDDELRTTVNNILVERHHLVKLEAASISTAATVALRILSMSTETYGVQKGHVPKGLILVTVWIPTEILPASVLLSK
jgi:hypothetical protein